MTELTKEQEKLLHKQPESNKVSIKLNYINIILDYKDGVRLMAALENAQMLSDSYIQETSKILSINESAITITPLSSETYLKCMRNTILGVED